MPPDGFSTEGGFEPDFPMIAYPPDPDIPRVGSGYGSRSGQQFRLSWTYRRLGNSACPSRKATFPRRSRFRGQFVALSGSTFLYSCRIDNRSLGKDLASMPASIVQ